MALHRDLRRHLHPRARLEALAADKFARQAHERDIRLTAGHHEAAGRKHALLLAAQTRDLPLERDRLSVVFLRLFGDVAVEQGVILVLDLDDARVDVERQRVDDLVELACAVGVFVHNIDLPVDRPGDLVERHDVRSRRHPVEHDQLRTHQLVHDQLAHIGIITLECLRISKHDLLRDHPRIRRLHVEVCRLMHAVQLGHDALGVVFPAQPLEKFRAELVIVRRLKIDILARVTGEVIFLLALFEHEQERLLAGVEARIFQRLLNEFRLAGLQKAGEDIHWDLLHRLLLSAPCRTARPRPVRSASSRSRRCGP